MLKNIQRLYVATLAAVTLGLPAGAAPALDPSKAITQYVLDKWQTESGLPQNSIRAIAQTSDGYLWLGTEEGLARFDGVRFTVFDKQSLPGLGTNEISVLLADRENGLWIGTDGGGLVRLQNGRTATYTTANGLPSDTILALYQDRRGVLWIGTDGGGLGSFKNGQFKRYGVRSGLPSDTVFSLTGDKEGRLWLGTHAGLVRFDNGKLTTYTVRDGLPGNDVRAVWVDRRGQVWAGTNGAGVACLSRGTFLTYTKRQGLTSDTVFSILDDNSGTVWLGTADGGLNRLRNGKVDSYTEKRGLSADQVLTLFQDREGSLWIGTVSGLNRLHDGSFTTFSSEEGASSDIVAPVYEDQSGAIWFGTLGGGLDRLKDGKISSITTKDGLLDNAVYSISGDGEGTLWVGTRRGLNQIRYGKVVGVHLHKDIALATYLDHQGTLWVGSRAGLDRFDGKRWTTYTTKDGLSADLVRAIYEDAQGALWIGTAGGGIDRFSGGHFISYTTRDGLSSDVIWSINGESDGTLWIGTNGGGLDRLRSGRFTAYTAKNGLLDDSIFQVIPDSRGNLWMSSNKGIFSVSKAQLDEFTVGRDSSIRFREYGLNDGMKSQECNGGFQPAGLRADDGRLYFPTMKGLVVVDPNRIKKIEWLPPAIVEAFTVDGTSYGASKAVKLRSRRGQLSFEFSAPSLVASNTITFKYLLEGFDKDWIDAGRRRVAYYTNIPPGEYHFRVIARTAQGKNTPEDSVAIVLLPQFYQTYSFAGLCLAGVVLLLIAGYRLRVRHLRTREKELVRLVHEHTRALRGSEKRFRQLAENIRELFWMADARTGQLVYLSPAFEQIWRRNPNRVLENRELWFEAVHAEDRERVKSAKQLQYEGQPVECEYRIVQFDQTTRWVWDRSFPVYDEMGRLDRIVGIVEDITERKAAQEDLQRSRDELASRVLELNAENLERRRVEEQLKTAKETAEAANRAKSEFLANMSHEIRTPMNAVIGMTELALATRLNSEQKEYLETVQVSAESLLSLINDILDFSKIEAQKLQIFPQEFSLRETVEQAVRSLALHAHQKGLELAFRVAPEIPARVISDAGRLRQILINLLGNAVKFTERGEVFLSIETARDAGEDFIHFAVHDTGIGIPASMQNRIFDAFTQVDGSSTRRFGGTGLGLTITSQLVKLMGGAIWLESEEGRGSTFHFHVPLPPVPTGIDVPEQNCEIGLEGLSVLVVDDNAVNRRILQEMLVHWGCKAVLADGGQEALFQLRKAQDRNEPFGLILTDAQMPVMDGFMFIEEVRSSSSHRPPAIMMLTSIDHGEAIQKCQDLGISAYLTKPVRRADLHRAIAEVMGKSMKPQHTAGIGPSRTLRNELSHILVVDDNPVNRKLAARLVEKRGFQVTTACNGKQAIQLTGETVFDLVFMDVQMPEMDGFEATQAIRERELSSARHLPIVAMTAHAMAGDRELCLDAGMDDYVSKPLRAADLDSVLIKFLLTNREQEVSPAAVNC